MKSQSKQFVLTRICNFLCRLSPWESDQLHRPAHLQKMREHVRVLQLVDETHAGGMRKSAEISMPLLPKEIEVTLQPVEAHANEARL